MLFLHGTTEPYPITLVVTAQNVFHASWNQTNSMEQDARTYYQTGALVLPFSFVVCVGLLIITYKAEGDRVMPTKVHEVDVRTSAVGMKTPTNPI